MKKMPNQKPPRSFRVNPELIERAKKEGLDIVGIFEAALAKALSVKICFCCGRVTK